jgi:hypothetical protein
MKTLLRMIVFVVVAGFLASMVAGVIVVLATQPLPSAVHERAASGDWAAEWQVATSGERYINIVNVVMWPILVGIIFGLERMWRALSPQPVEHVRVKGLLRWLGASAAGLIVARWVDSLYSLWLLLNLPPEYLNQPSLYARQLAEFGERLEALNGVTIVIWVVAAIAIRWLSRRSETRPAPSFSKSAS